MGKLRDDLRLQVEELRGAVGERDYLDAIATLKEIGGEVGAFAAMHAALVAGMAGSGAVLGYTAAFLNPFAATTVVIAGIGTVGLGYLFAADRLNRWYDELDSAHRQSLSRTIAYGIGKSRLLWRVWRILAR